MAKMLYSLGLLDNMQTVCHLFSSLHLLFFSWIISFVLCLQLHATCSFLEKD